MSDLRRLLLHQPLACLVSCFGLVCLLWGCGPRLVHQTGADDLRSRTLEVPAATRSAETVPSPSWPPTIERPDTPTPAITNPPVALAPAPSRTIAEQLELSATSPASISATPRPVASPSLDPTPAPQPTGAAAPISQRQVAAWIDANYRAYFQKYSLSCEAAAMRLACGALGITLTEDAILELMPRHAFDPQLGLVMEDINGSVYYADGSINWRNYGAHAPVVAPVLNRILRARGLQGTFRAEVLALGDTALRAELGTNPDCLGAIIWAAANIGGSVPPVNERGQVLGEHTQWVSPLLDDAGRMLVYDVWPWPNQPFHLLTPYNRALFGNQVVVIRHVRS